MEFGDGSLSLSFKDFVSKDFGLLIRLRYVRCDFVRHMVSVYISLDDMCEVMGWSRSQEWR